MFRNMYDTDVTVWSPEGRLLQVRVGVLACLLGWLTTTNVERRTTMINEDDDDYYSNNHRRHFD
jgi:hypothetical protein